MIQNAVNMPNLFLLLSTIATVLICECIAQLSVVKLEEGFKDGSQSITSETVVSTIDVAEGVNLTLTCYLKGSHYNTSNLVWGRKTKELKFKNKDDLLHLVLNKSEHIMELISAENRHSPLLPYPSERKTFIPVKFEDQGVYFCMSPGNLLFKIIHIKVHDVCASNKFMCLSNRFCINAHYVCDGHGDCKDGSDEAFSLCGSDPCKDKIPCLNRCIPFAWCCNRKTDYNCNVTVRSDCCPAIHDPYDPLNYYDSKDVDDVNKVMHKGASRYVFVIICVISGIFSFIIFLCIISRMCNLDSHRIPSHSNNYRTTAQQDLCHHSECAIRRQLSVNSPCFYNRQGGTNVNEQLIISFSNIRNDSDNPPSYSEVVNTSMRSISKLGVDDDSIAPPPPYSSTNFCKETENSNDNTCASGNIELNNSINCDISSTNTMHE